MIYNKDYGILANKWVSKHGKKVYKIIWDKQENTGSMIHNKSQSHINLYYWKIIN